MPRSSAGMKRARASERSTQQSEKENRTPAGDITRLHDRIAVRAFAIYEGRGKRDGHDLDDWFRAEQEVLGQRMDAGIS